ncbi:hypothetical protein Pcinc_024178 [Petrolisthes cinctipes]|uniref:Uncharacterized protein n=1 Tax=Petrolisthes cinctipes TaxID=88211 RepID=A0AAE1KFP0_PETCI|nr:hypothetical protein Pcinc_024178 [Petrolisthes cinctipes]
MNLLNLLTNMKKSPVMSGVTSLLGPDAYRGQLSKRRMCLIKSVLEERFGPWSRMEAHHNSLFYYTIQTSTIMHSPVTTINPAAAVLDQSLRSFGFDLGSLLKSVDVQTVGVVALFVLIGILLFDVFNYGYTSYAGDSSSYVSYGRSLATSAAKVWDEREQLGLSSGRGSRNLDTMTQVLDSLADAVLKYEELSDNLVDDTRQ